MNELPTREKKSETKPKAGQSKSATVKKGGGLFRSNGRMPVGEAQFPVPVAEYVPPTSHVAREVHLRLTADQAEMLYRITDGLKHKGAMLRNGSPVSNQVDALRWFCEQVTM